MKKYNWGIIGAGWIGGDMAQALLDVNGEVYGIYNRTLKKAQDFAAKYGVKHVFETQEAMLADPQVDIVYIATPHNAHYDVMMRAIEAGKHVLCEKAITVTYQQLESAVALAREKGVIVAEAMTMYHMPLIKKLREMVDGGVIGKVRMVQCNFGSTKPYDVDDRYFNADLAGGALLDIGVYAVAFLRYFLDQKPSVIVTSAEFAPTGVDETSGIILKTPSGMMAVCSLSLRSKQPKRGIISGEKGYIEIENYNRAESALIIRDGMEPETISLGSTAEALAYEAEGFQKAVERGYDETICQSSDVNEILSSVRNSWGHVYPFEERYLNR